MKSSENAFISCTENLEEQNKKCFLENCDPPQDYTNTKQNARKHIYYPKGTWIRVAKIRAVWYSLVSCGHK
jgi:hypothetical protein